MIVSRTPQLNYNHTIHFKAKLSEFQHLNARKTCVLYQHFQKVPTMGGGYPLQYPPPWYPIYTQQKRK